MAPAAAHHPSTSTARPPSERPTDIDGPPVARELGPGAAAHSGTPPLGTATVDVTDVAAAQLDPSSPAGPEGTPVGGAEGGRPDSASTVCPYLAADGGAWRASGPDPRHRCNAVRPDAPLTLDEQRRLCVTAAHVDCSAYASARRRRLGHLEEAGVPVAAVEQARFVGPRPTVPVALDAPARRAARRGWPVSGSRLILAGVLAIGVVLLAAMALLTRPDDRPAPGALAVASSTPSAPPPSPPPAPSATVAPGTPTPPVAGRTYRIRRGDSLGRIARRFGTTVAVLKELNDIPDPPRIRVGQVLNIP